MKIKNFAIIIGLLMTQVGIFSANAFGAPPANDMWESATQISGNAGLVSGVIDEATTQPCESVHFFEDDNFPTPPTRSVWYRWIAPEKGSYTFSTVAAAARSRVAAYLMIPQVCNGSPVTMPFLIRENRNHNLAYGSVNRSQITFTASPEQPIYISVENEAGSGEVTLSWSKTRYRFSAQFDSGNSATDLAVVRNTASPNSQWWLARSRSDAGLYPFTEVQSFGIETDKKLLGDLNGDGVSDLAAIRKSNGNLVWWISDRRGSLIRVQQFGLSTDKPVIGDYDGDGIGDIGVTRGESNGLKTWHIMRSSDGQYQTFQFGLQNDMQTIGDFDDDGKTDLAVIRQSAAPENKFTWYIRRSSDETVLTRQLGKFGDYPQVVDFDRDGRTDIAVFRSGYAGSDPNEAGNWYSINSGSSFPLDQAPVQIQRFGQQFDNPQAGDYDADDAVDLAVYRDGVWWIRMSRTGQVMTFNFGLPSDIEISDLGNARNF